MTTTCKRCDTLSVKEEVGFKSGPLILFVKEDTFYNHSHLSNVHELQGLEKILLCNKTILLLIFKYEAKTCKSQQVLQKYPPLKQVKH